MDARAGAATVESRREALRALPPEDYAVLQYICESNGLTEEQLVHRADEVKKVEMFLFNFGQMRCLHFFTGLRELNLSQQDICTVEGIEACTALEEVWLHENEIKAITGLETLANLRRLYMYSNHIKRIEGLANCTKLEVLWLANNEISELEGLETLEALTELNLAKNHIERVGDTLQRNPNLTSVNLAANRIGCFKEICNLARLRNLRDLCLADPHWGENPVAGLFNYQTYVLFTVQQLTSLDTLMLADETKQLAEATYMKKKMYYNMRIKTLRRNTSNALRTAADGKQACLGQASLTLNLLLRQQKDVERELDEHQLGFPGRKDRSNAAELQQQLCNKQDALNNAVARKMSETADIERYFDETKQRIYELTDSYVRRMMVELETGGNIRLEDGKPSDLWYSSCVDLLNSRFFAADFASTDIGGIRVTRVTRIHNRHLRNRFESRLESMVDVSDPSYKRSLEYLFYGEQESLPNELLRAAEDGFRKPHEYVDMGLDGAVRLSNSVSLSDSSRMAAAKELACEGGSTPQGRRWLTGQLLVTKVFLGKCSQDTGAGGKRSPNARPPRRGEAAWINAGHVSAEAYPEHNSVFRCKPNDPKQRLWYVFDSELVLPEYLVEFEYELKPAAYAKMNKSLGVLGRPTSEARAAAVPERLDFDVRPIARPALPFLVAAAEASAADTDSAAAAGAQMDDSYAAVLNLPPALAPRPKVFMMSEETFQKQMPNTNLDRLTYLNLHGNAIRRVEALGSLYGLKTLILSFNEISKIEGLSDLTKLERLELGFNLIKRIEGLRGLSNLLALEMNNNLLYRLEDLNVLKKYTPGLTNLNLRSNALCENKSYRGIVLRRLPKLQTLDGGAVSEADRTAAADDSSMLTVQLIRANAFASQRTTWSIVSGGAPGEGGSKRGEGDDGGDGWWERVEEVVIEHQRVRRLQNLERLVRMRRASFCDNELSRIEGLETCVALEELSLEGNRLMTIEGLGSLVNLKKLDLGKNKIQKCENMGLLAALTQLSLEDNEITSLGGLSSLVSLMELYIGNNNVSELREVQQLKNLPKLIILDLLGNPLCQDEDYRLYIVYHLRKLKVLDGLGIEATEQALAKNKYAGKLTRDFLEEKVGHRFFEHLRELDLSSQRVRDLGVIFQSDEFACLRELNLDGNFLTQVSVLSGLPALTVLRVNHNRLDSLPLCEESDALADGDDGEQGAALSDAQPDCFPVLEALQLGGNAINHLPGLRLWNLRNLKILFLQDNEITKLEGIEGLVNLQELVLDRNKIKFLDAHSFSGLVNLRELRLEENGLRSLSYLSPLVKLQSLHLACNRIVEVAEVEKLAAHVQLLELTLSNNPVSRKQVYRPMLLRNCPSLKFLDGREVTMEERDHVEQLFAPADHQATLVAQGVNASGLIQQQPTHKVPIKLTSMNFEALIVSHGVPALVPQGHHGLDIGGVPIKVPEASQVRGVGRPTSHEQRGGPSSHLAETAAKVVDRALAGNGNGATSSFVPNARSGRMGNVVRSYYRT